MTDNKYWQCLEMIRRSGVTNMYGAAPYLAEIFDIDIKKAREILFDWMEKYNPDDYKGMRFVPFMG